MSEEDCLLGFFGWLLPSVGFSVMLGFVEQFGYQLRECQPQMAPWLRGVILQYLLMDFLMMYFVLLPDEYWRYVKRFAQGNLFMILLGIIVIMHLVVPWVTLTLHLRLRSVCADRILIGHSILYWIVFALQALIFLLILTTLYIFYEDLQEKYWFPWRVERRRQVYVRRVAGATKAKKNLRQQYAELLREHSGYRQCIVGNELFFFRRLLRRRLDQKCLNMLKTQHRICFQCKGDFEVCDKVHFLEQCGHLAHWECFESILAQSGKCSECGQACLVHLKLSIVGGAVKALDQLLAVPPSVQPSNMVGARKPLGPQAVPAIPRVTIEYFAYTAVKREAITAPELPAPVAETEI